MYSESEPAALGIELRAIAGLKVFVKDAAAVPVPDIVVSISAYAPESAGALSSVTWLCA